VLVAAAACDSNNNAAPIGIAQEPVVGEHDALPGVVVAIEALRGGSGPNGRFRVGDTLEVDFTVARNDGEPLELSTFVRGAAMVSGPTFNYQRVIGSQDDVVARATKRAVGAYTYRFPVTIPAKYLAPLNDTTALTDGELTDQALLSGTYTVGFELRKDYTIGETVYRDAGNATIDFLLGDATAIEPREVVTMANCNSCHVELKAHGDNRDKIGNCLLCHTAGSEDGNDPNSGGGTPGIGIDFRVLIHKIHAGKNLPSVNGVTTDANGNRVYGTGVPYVVQGYRSSLHDYSDFAFPVWPSMMTPMPRDAGYTALTSGQKAAEDAIRGGPVDCTKCHGDPDGDGPLPPPAQGDLAYSQPTRQACGSCHDDWVFDHPYIANGQTMPIQRDDAACKECHRVSGTALDVVDAHRHPLTDTTRAPGLLFDILSVTDVGGNANGKFDAGEKIEVQMTIKNAAGNDIAASSLSRMEIVLNGPTANPNLVNYARVGVAGLGSAATYTFRVPANVYYEPIGTSTASLQTFATARAPHWNVSGAATALLRRTGVTFSTTLAADAPALQNFLDLAPGAGASFAKDNYLVIEDAVPGRREFLKIQRVDGDRLWFSSAYSQNYAPGTRFAHAAGSTIDKLSTATVATSSYSLDALTGIVTETVEFGTGEILASYTTDFVVPDVYPGTFNDSLDLDATNGDWIGLPIVAGTYNLGIYGARGFTVPVGSESSSYTEGSKPEIAQILFGSATEITNVARIDSSAGCYRCHEDIQFHGGSRRGYETCTLCHTVAGAEDAANYVYPNGAPSPGVTIDFRTMLHKIHHGKELSDPLNYVIAGFGGTGHTYEHVGFPAMPGGTQNCAVCHGDNNTAWVEPAERNHPSSAYKTRAWRAVCASCHDDTAARAHVDVNTNLFGAEACSICHGEGEDLDVRTVHKLR
jgi:OmcA/MtrC family decaheme c-type cytochrome